MSEEITKDSEIHPSASTKKDRIEVVKVLAMALVSFAIGFVLVYVFLAPGSSQDQTQAAGGDMPSAPAPVPAAAPAAVAAAPSAPIAPAGGYAPPEPGKDAGAASATPVQAAAASDAGPHEGDALPEVAPGKTPDGVAVDGAAFYLKCWDAEGVEHPGEECDKLAVLDKRFATRLYVVDKCRAKAGTENAKGKLSLGVEADFQNLKVSYWNGASSTVAKSGEIAGCLRTEMAGLPLGGIEHKYARYRMFFTVTFGSAAEVARADAQAAKAEAKPGAKPEAAKEGKTKAPPGKGRVVKVTKDKVRVRKTPKDGEVIGKISTGNEVRLLEQKSGWCHVMTPNSNDGWMTCDALAL
ncbi:MAG: SH3 domain-containing protein [Deltaproteobacteria bacterium]|nr:SH3 domain-containing protein [Deltaproteobacteria bacterium]